MKNVKVIDISKKVFISVTIILFALMILTIILTYVIPKSDFLVTVENGKDIIHYDTIIPLESFKGINIFKGLLSPILLLFSKDGLSLIMLIIFILVISASFQAMSDCSGMKIIVQKMINRFKNHKYTLIGIIILVFMCFGSFFGLFEEVLTLLPIIILLTLSLGYDSFLGFVICIVATGFGFASGITNPFTVLIASNIIGVSPMSGVWYRIIIFIVMYMLIFGYAYLHIKRIEKNPKNSITYEKDLIKKNDLILYEYVDNKDNKRIFRTYLIFLTTVLITIITVTSIESIRGLSVVFLIVIFLFGGFISAYIASKDIKKVLKSFLSGIVSALPAVVMVLMASSIKYILEEGHILASITNTITNITEGKNNFILIIILFLIILVLEFFISSSTAKAMFVMGILKGVTLNISSELLVLTYLFGDGYTNVIFPTSPVLLLALSITGVSYISWVKKSKWLFLITFLLTLIFLFLGIILKV